MRALVSNCIKNSKLMEASAHFASVEEDDIATLLSNRDSLNAIKASINESSTVLFT